MANYNKVILVGNLTADPELRYTPQGTAVCDLRLAINRIYTVNGERREDTVFVDVVVWDKTAENCEQFLHKGSPILVEGRLQMDEWQGKDGQKRSKLRIRADRLQFLGSSRRPAGVPGATASAYACWAAEPSRTPSSPA